MEISLNRSISSLDLWTIIIISRYINERLYEVTNIFSGFSFFYGWLDSHSDSMRSTPIERPFP